KCGTTNIYSVCHHCARPMCERDSRFAFRVSGSLARDPGMSGKPASSEYDGLKLDSTHAAVYHCEEHDHQINTPGRLVIIGAAVAAVGLIVTFAATLPGIVILLAGAAVAVYGVIKVR